MNQGKGSVLVTGGCGYIGSHVTCLLSEAGYNVVVLDNLSSGYRSALLHGETLVVGDLADEGLLRELFARYAFQAVFHFAASIIVPESLQKPLEYYENNTVNTWKLLKHARDAGTVRHFVLSSTAAVYGFSPTGRMVAEGLVPAPIHPYGRSKLMDEWMLEDTCRTIPMRYVALRYFNVAGADPELRLGQRGPVATHLIKIASEVAVQKRQELVIFGTNYDTADGTCVRDYVHVTDLARAHLAALHYLEADGKSVALNCGYSRGYSVREILATCQEVLERPLPAQEGPPRVGDVPYLVADAGKIRSLLGWQPAYADLKSMIASAFAWEKKLLGP